MNEQPYSYHTFLFPFRWDGRTDNILDDFTEKLDPKKWNQMDWDERKGCFDKTRDRRIEYNEYEYFHENVRNAIYGSSSNLDTQYPADRLSDSDVVRNFIFRNAEAAVFEIKKGKAKWELKLNAIRLKIFNTGVAILIYELENYDKRSMEDVLKINEYGRRIDIPYVSDYDNSCSLVADYVTIRNKDSSGNIDPQIVCKFKDEIDKFNSSNVNYRFISPIIMDVLGDSFKFSGEVENTDNSADSTICCHVIGDDRMFVCCLVEDKSFIKEITVWDNEKQKYAWEIDCIEKPYWEQSKLYEFAFIDGNGISCVDRNERLCLLKKHMYTRFAEYNLELEKDPKEKRTLYGTFAVITHHSMVCATNFVGEVTPFLTMRIQMVILTLAQRASIIALSNEASRLAEGFDDNSKVGKNQIKRIKKLREKHVAFQNQLLFFEITAQEQGVEVYDRLQESLYIHRESEKLEQQLQNLHEIATLISDQRLNQLLKWIAIVGLPIAAASMIFDMLSFFCK